MTRSPDMVMLARLHAALDAVVEAQQQLGQVGETPTIRRSTVTRANALVSEARELLDSLLRSEVDTVSGRRAA